MTSSESEQSSSRRPAPGIGTSPPVGIGTAPPVTITGTPTYLPPPPRVSPARATPAGAPGVSQTPGIPADLFAAWRSLMSAVGQTVPYHLNRTVTIARLLRRGS